MSRPASSVVLRRTSVASLFVLALHTIAACGPSDANDNGNADSGSTSDAGSGDSTASGDSSNSQGQDSATGSGESSGGNDSTGSDTSSDGTSTTDLPPCEEDIPETDSGSYENDYQKRISEALRFFGAQRCGDGHNWTLADNDDGDSCHLEDGDDAGGVDLTGGWHDAGDHLKFSVTHGIAAYTLLKAFDAFPAAFKDMDDQDYSGKSNGVPDVLDEVNYALDYMQRQLLDDGIVVRVGGLVDHDYWWTSPYQSKQSADSGGNPREVLVGAKGDVAGLTAAALALGSIKIRDYDAKLADAYLDSAKEFFKLAKSNRGITDSSPDLKEDKFYDGDDTDDDSLLCGAVELYRATKEQDYLDLAHELNTKLDYPGATVDYGNPGNMCRHSLQALDEPSARLFLEGEVSDYFNYVEADGDLKGLYYLRDSSKEDDQSRWGSLRYAAGVGFSSGLAWQALCHSKKRSDFSDFAIAQADWILGDNPFGHSFVVGVGSGAPKRPQHKNSCGINLPDGDVPTDDVVAKYPIVGAMVGGPSRLGYEDSFNNYEANEVTIEYNAMYVGVLAARAHLELVK